jgi:hypothetical protein
MRILASFVQGLTIIALGTGGVSPLEAEAAPQSAADWISASEAEAAPPQSADLAANQLGAPILTCSDICSTGISVAAAPLLASACAPFGVVGAVACGLAPAVLCNQVCADRPTRRCVRHGGGKVCVSNQRMWICDGQVDGHRVRGWWVLAPLSLPREPVATAWAPSQGCHVVGWPNRTNIEKFRVCVEEEGCSDWIPALGAHASAVDDEALPDTSLTPLWRYWNPNVLDHFYTINRNDLGYGYFGYGFERAEGRIFREQEEGTVPVYQYWNPDVGDHFLVANWQELGGGKYGYSYEGVAGYVYPIQYGGTVPIYRYWSASAGDHFYTKDYYPGGFCYGHCYGYEGALGYVLP